jgi:hypothetical protein
MRSSPESSFCMIMAIVVLATNANEKISGADSVGAIGNAGDSDISAVSDPCTQ